MKVSGKRHILHPSRTDTINIWNLSDLHVGNKSCALKMLQRDIDIIKDDPNSFWIGGGDYADYIGFTDKRFDPDCVAENISVSDLGKLGKKLTDDVIELFRPISNKCLGLLFGNHEAKYERWNEQQGLHHYMCVELGVPDLSYSALFDVVFVRTKTKKIELYSEPQYKQRYTKVHSNQFRFFVHHGAGFATTAAGKLNKLISFFNSFDADIYMCGHVHDQTGKRDVTIGADTRCKKLTQRHKLGVISGGYLKTYSEDVTGYGEMRGYSPTCLGAARVFITPCEADPMQRVKGTI